MNIQELIEIGSRVLKNNQIEDSHIKARGLAKYILEMSKEEILIYHNKEVTKQKETAYFQWIDKIAQGMPLQYITNNQEFMGLDFYVDENVLIPQPDTEILVEETIKELETIGDSGNAKTIRILDLCTGSGAIAISIANNIQKMQKSAKERNANIDKKEKRFNNSKVKFEIYALDISKKALEIARKNAIQNEVDVSFILSDMFENIKQHHTKLEFDIIVSNPPYIETNTIKTLTKEVQNEPHLALDGGKDGLDFYRIIAKQAIEHLKQKRKYLIRNRIQSKEQCYRNI